MQNLVGSRTPATNWQNWTRHGRCGVGIVLLWLVTSSVISFSRLSQSQGKLSLLFKQGSGGKTSTDSQRVPCYGPRDTLLSDSPDDELRYSRLDEISYPTPFLGSHRELHAEQVWMTADARYGPYGFGEDEESYNRTRVSWAQVDWGKLQNDCFERNKHRFPIFASSGRLKTEPRLSWKNRTDIDLTPDPKAINATQRTALILRTWANFDYKPEDLWSIRSLIVETSLGTGGDYSVILLVHVQDREKNIFQSKENYDAAFKAANIPPELQSIAVLWDDHLLESWYDKIEEHRTIFQVNQPLQLFAMQYPEYDHYWQIEMDQRFLGDVGKYMDALSTFARLEPRKQALERATFTFNDDIYGTYDNFIRRVDIANHGKSRAWGPIRIPDIDPIGPQPPVLNPEDDDFIWGVGEDADVIVTSFCADVLQSTWTFKDWIGGFVNGHDTPRWFCPPAIMRGSRKLILAVHQAQLDKGLILPSEATLPSWALWHGLKLSYPPQPAYMRPHEPDFFDWRDDTTRDPARWLDTTVTPWFGNVTELSPDGLSHANPQSWADMGMSFWWLSDYPRRIMDVWLKGDAAEASIPGVLAVQDGKIYGPNMVMHPVKT